MPDKDARDAWTEVEIDLPNKVSIRAKLIPFRKGLELKLKLYKFSETLAQEDFDALWGAFERATGITEARLQELCPDLTLLELTDFISRFIYLLRPVPTAAAPRSGTPAATVAPSLSATGSADSVQLSPTPV